MKTKILSLLIVILAFQLNAAEVKRADLLLRNCTVITMDDSQPLAQAVAIAGDRIAWVGNAEDAQQWIAPNTQQLDLKGAFVYPGLIDSHVHLASLGFARVEIDLVNTPDKQTILRKVAERIRTAKKGEWIQGHGWDQNDWPQKDFPTAADLDTVSINNPVVLERIDGHAIWVNSHVLKIAGIDTATKDPSGGKIIRDSQARPTGILVDNAADLVYRKIPPVTDAQIIRSLEMGQQEALRKGLTMIHDAGTSAGTAKVSTVIRILKNLASENRLALRFYSMVFYPSDYADQLLTKGPEQHGPYLDIRALKMVMDGAMGSRGAALLEPYSDDPDNRGLITLDQNVLKKALVTAKAKRLQVGVHAIGDRANRIVLDEFEKTAVQDLRWRIEHAQLLALSDIPRFTPLGVIASMQPIHATSDMPWTPDRVGPERVKGAYAWRSLLKNKTIIAGGSDAPVEDINPLWGIYAALTRQDHRGKPPGGWLPEQKVTPQEALRMFTIDAAYAAFRENELGSVKTGKLADLVVLPKNLLECDPRDLIDMKVLYTIVGGKIRYKSK